MTWWQKWWDRLYQNRFVQVWYQSLTNRRGGPSATKLTALFLTVATFWPAYITLTIWSFMNGKWADWVTVCEIILWTILGLLVGNIANKWVERKTQTQTPREANPSPEQNEPMRDP